MQRTCLMAPVRASQVASIGGHQAGGIDAPRGHHSTIPDACKAVTTIAPHHLQQIRNFTSVEVYCADMSESRCRNHMQHMSCPALHLCMCVSLQDVAARCRPQQLLLTTCERPAPRAVARPVLGM